MNKKNLIKFSLVCVILLFAYLVLADLGSRVDVSVISPVINTNYSGNMLLNATVNETADNVTFYFYNATSGSLVYSRTISPDGDGSVNDTFNETINTVTFLADDVYSLIVNATNSSGYRGAGEEETNASITWVQIDNTAPSVTINNPNTNDTIGLTGNFTFLATIVDSGVGIDSVNMSNNSYSGKVPDQNGTSFNVTYTATELGEGIHILNVTANDTLNNINNSESVSVTVDLTAPTVNLEVGQALDNYTWTDDSTPDFVFNFTDNLSPNASCELFIDETSYGTNTTTSNNTQTTITANTALTQGEHSWYVNCTDLGDNVGSSLTTSDSFVFDYETVTATPTNNSWSNGTAINSTAFSFSFVSNLTNTASCELWITNASGDYIANGVNTTTLNSTTTTILNNNTLTSYLATNWTINCTWNNTQITTINNDYYRLNVDNVTPTVSVSCSDITAGSSQSCSCSGTDNSGETPSTSVTSPSTASAGTNTVNCTATDLAGNTNSTTTTYTVSAASSSSSGGGGGGSASQQVAGQFSKKVWNSVSPDKAEAITISSGDIGITDVEFSVNKKVWGAWMKVAKKDDLPGTVKAFSKKAYKYIEISKGNALKDDVLKEVTIKFKVLKSWLTENGLSEDNIALHRFHNDEWVELDTTLKSDDGAYVHYTAETPGFSYFTIGESNEKATVASTFEEVDDSSAETTTESTSSSEESAASTGDKKTIVEKGPEGSEEATGLEVTSKKSSSAWLWILLAVVIVGLAGGGYYFWSNSKKK